MYGCMAANQKLYVVRIVLVGRQVKSSIALSPKRSNVCWSSDCVSIRLVSPVRMTIMALESRYYPLILEELVHGAIGFSDTSGISPSSLHITTMATSSRRRI